MVDLIDERSLVKGLNEVAFILYWGNDVINNSLLVIRLFCLVVNFTGQKLFYSFENEVEMLIKIEFWCKFA